jgi:Signal peptidase (SPase) II
MASRTVGPPPISQGVALLRLHGFAPDRAAAAGAAAFLVALAIDLLTKTYAITQGGLGHVVYNDAHAGDFPRRVAMSVLAVAVTAVIAGLARRQGFGRLWGGWIGVGLLVGGVLGNGLSRFIWSRGVPDFIHTASADIWNVADFEIAIGLTGGIVSMAIAAIIAYARERRTLTAEEP